MKKFFALAIALVSMAVSMTSCHHHDTDFIEQKAPVANQQTEVKKAIDLEFVVMVSPEQMNYMDESYVLEVGSQQMTVKVADMTLANAEKTQQIVKQLGSDFKPTGANDMLYYTFSLGQFMPNQTAKVVGYNATVKENHPTEEFDIVHATSFYSSSEKGFAAPKCHYFKGVAGDDESTNGFAQILNECQDGATFTY